MSKIICDVCGTKYPESAEQCPICGHIRETRGAAAAESYTDEEFEVTERPRVRGGRFSKSNVRKRNREMPRYEMEESRPTVTGDDDEEFGEELGPRKKSNTVINILLVIVILALLAVTGYILMEFILPNVMPGAEETVPSTAAPVEQTQAPTETEEPRIPCTSLTLDEAVVLLEREGQEWLVNVAVAPEDTTDELVFTSADESVVMVDADGKVTAVGEGDTTITITCGDQQAHCTIAVVFDEGSTEEPKETEGEDPGETTGGTGETEAPSTDATDATDATDGPTEPLKDVKLTLKQSDVTFRTGGQQATFKLTCGLKASEVQWSSEDEDICTVDENGIVTRTGKGTTNVVVKYGDQEVKVIVRCP